MDFMNPESVLDLNNVRRALERMEDSIIFGLIERSQYTSLPLVYQPGKFSLTGMDCSFLTWHLMRTEELQLQLRRYTAPDETPFFPDALQQPVLPLVDYPKILSNEKVLSSVNDIILDYYVKDIVPQISCAPGDQIDTWGSVLLADITCLQTISRRVHFGRFVAEAKYRANKALYIPLILRRDVTAIGDSITNKAVEDQVIARLEKKADQYSHQPQFGKNISTVKPEVVAGLYRKFILLTKDVEVKYLLARLRDEDPKVIEQYR